MELGLRSNPEGKGKDHDGSKVRDQKGQMSWSLKVNVRCININTNAIALPFRGAADQFPGCVGRAHKGKLA